MPGKFITREELGALVGVSGKRNFQVWERHGLPYREEKSRRGSPTHLYEERRALEWLQSNAATDVSSRAKRILDGTAAEKTGGKTAAGTGAAAKSRVRKTSRTGGGGGKQDAMAAAEAACRRIREDEKLWAARVRSHLKKGDDGAASRCEKNRLMMAKAIVELTAQMMQLKERLGILVVVDEVKGDFAKLLTALKNNVTGVPDSAVPSLIPYLRNPEDANAVRELLTGLVEDALRSVTAKEVFD